MADLTTNFSKTIEEMEYNILFMQQEVANLLRSNMTNIKFQVARIYDSINKQQSEINNIRARIY